VPADRDEPVRVELVHESERSRVSRLFLPGRTLIRKEPLGRDAPWRLRQELAMLERLRGVAGVAQLVETPDAPRYPGSIVLALGDRLHALERRQFLIAADCEHSRMVGALLHDDAGAVPALHDRPPPTSWTRRDRAHRPAAGCGVVCQERSCDPRSAE
jgi:hypothetical protein